MSTPDLENAVNAALAGAALNLDAFCAPEQAGSNLRLLMGAFRESQDLRVILEDVIKSAAPDMALNNLERFLALTPTAGYMAGYLAEREDVRQAMVTLFAGSQFLSDVLIAQTDAFHWLMDENALWTGRSASYYREMARHLADSYADTGEQRQVLSRWRRREMLRVGMRDLLGLASMEEVTRDISDLAQAIIQVAAEIVYQSTAAKFGHPVPESASWDMSLEETALPTAAGMCVLGMGKLGGRELNFSSDIDLVFIYEAEGETTGRMDGLRRVAVVSNHVFFSRMGEALVKFLAERGPEGNLFRVDMRLRPEGQDGPLVRSLESFIHYLSSQARDWERIAYLKARVMSGPSHLTERLYRIVSRFVYAGVEPGQIIREVQALKVRIDREVMMSDLYEREVKRGYGGIREIEFVIAAMQIIHGYTHHALRVRNVFLAIQRLQEVHVLSDEEAIFYLRAYSFLRLIEHRLQMAEEHQTHTLPLQKEQLHQLARRCGYVDADTFQAEYTAITGKVHAWFVQFFEEDVTALDEEKRDLLVITDRDAPEAEAAAALARRGVTQTDAVRLVHALAFGTREVFISPEGQRSFEQMLPSLLRLITSAPIPERVLRNLHSFAMSMKSITYYYEVMAQHPEILRMLTLLFGTSSFYSDALIAHPEYFDALISSRVLEENDDQGAAKRQRMSAALQSKLMQRRLVLLRRSVHFENLLTVLRYLLKLRPLNQLLHELSSTADIAMNLGMQLTAQRMSGKAGETTGQGLLTQLQRNFAVVALGKYGGEELNFFGDLDMVFVYRDNEVAEDLARVQSTNAASFSTNVADTLTAVLGDNLQGGRAFVLDARLRPHGRSAPHATPVSQYVHYILHEAQVWELQALTRQRLVWGDESLWQEVTDAVRARCELLVRDSLRAEIRAMRERLETAAAESVQPGENEFKRSAGGLVDIEFILQYLSLMGDVPIARNYFEALRDEVVIARLGAAAAPLRTGYEQLRSLETAVRMVSGRPESALPNEAAGAVAVARLLGKSVDSIREELQRCMSAIREAYSAVVG